MNTDSKTTRKYLTIPEFCEQRGLSRSFYYKLRRQGIGPTETRVGLRKVIIADTDAATYDEEHRVVPSPVASTSTAGK
jgi:predicted DNA-binding transcriptional regulator AlpA